ncbi:hypothetical protein [Planomonospora sp. ID67723]|nr:hypothetical protein [Planomonospora sp. ID67723]
MDEEVAAHPGVVVGGVRHPEPALPGAAPAGLENAEVLRLAN